MKSFYEGDAVEVEDIFTREEIVGIRNRARSLSDNRHPASRQWHQWMRLVEACIILLDDWPETTDEETRSER